MNPSAVRLHVVLVRTESSGNVGAAARAAANMGADRLVLIDPRCDVMAEEARQMAAGAQEVLQGAVRYSGWDDFYRSEGDGLRIALTRRAGRLRKVYPLSEMMTLEKLGADRDVYLIFGPEADGLDAADLAFTHASCYLPVYGEFGSLNLAQAVLLALFQARQVFAVEKMPGQVKGDDEIENSVQPMYFPDGLIREWLTAMGFDIRARRASAYLTLRRLLLFNRPTRHEIQVLEAILQQNVRKLREKNERLVGFTAEQLADDGRNVVVEDI